MTVHDMLKEAGCGAHLTFDFYADAAAFADAIADKVRDPINRARFAAEAADDIRRASHDAMDNGFSPLWDEIEYAQDSFCGPTELWGSAMQGAWHADGVEV